MKALFTYLGRIKYEDKYDSIVEKEDQEFEVDIDFWERGVPLNYELEKIFGGDFTDNREFIFSE